MRAMVIRFAPRLLALCVPLALVACGGKDDPGTNPNPTPTTPPVAEVTLSSLVVSPDAVQVHAGLTLQLSARGTFSDGTERDLTQEVEWTSSDEAIATISNDDNARGLLRGLAQGAVTVRVKKGEITGERAGTIDPAQLTALAIEGATDGEQLARGATKALVARGTFTDDSSSAVTSELTWRSSDTAIATVSNEGVVTGVAVGAVSITVSRGDLSATIGFNVACVYPGSASGTIGIPGSTATSPWSGGGIFPNLTWPAARNADGTTFEFSTADIYCGRVAPETKVLFFVIGAGWCPNCPAYVRRTNTMMAQIEEAGGKVVYVEMQDTNYDPTDSTNAHNYINRLLGPGAPGIRVGDTDISRPANLPFNRSGRIEAVPFVIAVRVSDMQYIADSGAESSGGSTLNISLVDVARDPQNKFPPKEMCEPGSEFDEDKDNNNDSFESPSGIGLGQPLAGAMCGDQPDYFWIDTPGAWRATLNFTHRAGDLDMYVWDTFADRPLSSRGQPIGSTGNTDQERIDWQGPSVIRVEGYQGGQGRYTLTVEER